MDHLNLKSSTNIMSQNIINEKIILGLSHAHHDGAACIVKGGKILAAIECERLTKRKKDDLTPSNIKETINYVLEAVEMELKDIDYLAVSSSPHTLHENQIECADNAYNLGIEGCMIAHHLAHNAAAYYTSPFDYSISLSVDASNGVPEYYFQNSSKNK